MKPKTKENTPPTDTITLTWSGKQWNVTCSVLDKNLVSEYAFTIPLPKEAIRPVPAQNRLLLFKAETWLYLPLRAVRQADVLDKIIGKHFHERGLRLPPDEAKSYVPIRLLEDLYVQKTNGRGTWRTAPCQCQIAEIDRIFPSLNQLAQHALREWTNNKAATIDVFQGVAFYYLSFYWPIDYQRRHVTNGDPLPKVRDPGEGTPSLPGLNDA